MPAHVPHKWDKIEWKKRDDPVCVAGIHAWFKGRCVFCNRAEPVKQKEEHE